MKNIQIFLIIIPFIYRFSVPVNRLAFTRLLLIFSSTFIITTSLYASTNLTQFSLEDLMTMKITSVSKKSQKISEAAAAIHVITAEDIRRSGMTSIPELLRRVPGLHVARINSNSWAISSRGFNNRFSNKLLVLMDGRTLYTPLFSGVYWDSHNNVPLEDIERIEVIRGPGGSLWGANAVNGIINIITKHSRDSQGGLASFHAGNQEKVGTLRYGGTFTDKGWFRTYLKTHDGKPFEDALGHDQNDAWEGHSIGFKANWETSSKDSFTFQGDYYREDVEQQTNLLNGTAPAAVLFPLSLPNNSISDTAKIKGENLLFNWTHTLSNNSSWQLQTYLDRAVRNDIALHQRIDTFDLDFQYRFKATEHQELTWGIGYRRVEDKLNGSFALSFQPDQSNENLYNLFVQDEIRLSETLTLTVGSKFEDNNYTGLEIQPSVRLLWNLHEKHTLWGAVSQAVRTPSRSNRDIRINVTSFSVPGVDPDGPFGPLAGGDPILLSIFGDKSFKSEELLALEWGYRGKPRPDLTVDISAFYNIYDNLSSSERSFGVEGAPPTHGLIASTFMNNTEAKSYGAEISANWKASSNWRLFSSYAWLKLDAWLNEGSTSVNNVSDIEKSAPRQQFQLHSYWNIRHDIELDLSMYYTDNLIARGSAGETQIPSYTRFDARLAWHPKEQIELSLVLQNLLDDQHREIDTTDIIPSEIPRTIYAKAKILF